MNENSVKDMERISIIIPVYNTEMYIKRCLQSILTQTYQNFEIIIVDDGSTDRSIEICKEFALKSRKIKILHIENSGVSAARNIGIRHSTGNYICFIDSDDFIDCFLFEKVISCFTMYNCDMVKFGATIVHNSENKIVYDVKNCNVEIFNTSNALQEYFYGNEKKLKVQVWSGVYRKELFKNIEFPIGKAYEDSYVTPHLIVKSEIIVYLDYPGYFYYMRSASIMHTGLTESKIAAYDLYKILFDVVCKPFPEYENFICEKWVYQYIYTYRSIIKSRRGYIVNRAWRKKIYKELWKQKKFLLQKEIGDSCRKQLYLFLLSPLVFNICIDFMDMDMKSKRKGLYE